MSKISVLVHEAKTIMARNRVYALLQLKDGSCRQNKVRWLVKADIYTKKSIKKHITRIGACS